MEDYSILVLPEISELILQHLDAKDRKQAVLVYPTYYSIICRLKGNHTLVLNTRKVIDDETFRAMMDSIREFDVLKVFLAITGDETTIAERTIAIAEKFKRKIKSLVVSTVDLLYSPTYASTFPIWLRELYSSLLDTLADVEELTLLEFPYQTFPQKEFKKLRKLSVYGYEHASRIFRLIPDDSLESLTVKFRSTLNQRCLQMFVNRQRKLKKLEIAERLIVNIGHLALEDLAMHMTIDSDPMCLRNQTKLRRLNCGMIGGAAFEEVLEMRNLEFLCAAFFEEVTGELSNLKELVLDGKHFFLRQVRLPKLEKLTLGRWISLTPEDFAALSLSAPNLKCIVIKGSKMGFQQASDLSPAPTAKNQILEELTLWKPAYSAPTEVVVDFINSYENIKRIQLAGVPLSDLQILEMIRSNPQLTHFWFDSIHLKMFRRHNFVARSIDPVLKQIIDIFRDSPNFVSLSFWGIAEQHVIDYLSPNSDQIFVSSHFLMQIKSCLQLTKKSTIYDPFYDRFEKQAETFNGDY